MRRTANNTQQASQRQHALKLRTLLLSWGPSWRGSRLLALALFIFSPPHFSFANDQNANKPRTTARQLVLEHLRKSNLNCAAIITGSDGQHRISYEPIGELIHFNREAKTGLGRVENEMFLQYTTDIIVLSRNNLIELAKRMAKVWTAAQSNEITKVYDEAVSLAKQTHSENGKPGGLLPSYFYSLPYAPELFPAIADLIEHPELFQNLRPHARAMLTTAEPPAAKKAGKAIKRSGEIGRNYGTRFKLTVSKEIEGALRADMIEWELAAFQKAISELSDNLIRPEDKDKSIEKELVRRTEYRPNIIASWHTYMNFKGLDYASQVWFSPAHKLLTNFIAKLERKFPISDENKKIAEVNELRGKVLAFDPIKSPFAMLGKAYDEQSQSLHLVERAAVVQPNLELATTEIIPVNADKLIEQLAPTMHMWPGAGTNKSSVASNRSQVGLGAGFGFLVHATDPADTATGVFVNGDFLNKTAYGELALRDSFKRFGQPVNGVPRPFSGLGRSMGGLAVMLGNAMNPELVFVDQFIGISTSIPDTLPPQITNVYAQAEAGSINGVIEEALIHATQYANTGMDAIKAAYRQDKLPFKLLGNKEVRFQGVSDEDAKKLTEDQLDPEEAAIAQRNKYSPMAHLIIMKDPLLKYGKRFDNHDFDELRQGAHFLMSAMEDLTLAEVNRNDDYAAFRADPEKGLPAVAEQDLPKLRTQLETIYLHIWGHLDYLINGLPGGHEWPDAGDRASQERLRQYRDFVAPGKSLFENFLDRLNASDGWKRKGIKITIEDIKRFDPAAPIPSHSADIARWVKLEAFSEAYRFWNEKEPARILHLYQEFGVIPK